MDEKGMDSSDTESSSSSSSSSKGESEGPSLERPPAQPSERDSPKALAADSREKPAPAHFAPSQVEPVVKTEVFSRLLKLKDVLRSKLRQRPSQDADRFRRVDRFEDVLQRQAPSATAPGPSAGIVNLLREMRGSTETAQQMNDDTQQGERALQRGEILARAMFGKGKEQSDADKEAKRKEFIAKLRKQLGSVKDATERQQKLVYITGMLTQRAGHLLTVAGMDETAVKALIKNLEQDFGIKDDESDVDSEDDESDGDPEDNPPTISSEDDSGWETSEDDEDDTGIDALIGEMFAKDRHDIQFQAQDGPYRPAEATFQGSVRAGAGIGGRTAAPVFENRCVMHQTPAAYQGRMGPGARGGLPGSPGPGGVPDHIRKLTQTERRAAMERAAQNYDSLSDVPLAFLRPLPVGSANTNIEDDVPLALLRSRPVGSAGTNSEDPLNDSVRDTIYEPMLGTIFQPAAPLATPSVQLSSSQLLAGHLQPFRPSMAQSSSQMPAGYVHPLTPSMPQSSSQLPPGYMQPLTPSMVQSSSQLPPGYVQPLTPSMAQSSSQLPGRYVQPLTPSIPQSTSQSPAEHLQPFMQPIPQFSSQLPARIMTPLGAPLASPPPFFQPADYTAAPSTPPSSSQLSVEQLQPLQLGTSLASPRSLQPPAQATPPSPPAAPRSSDGWRPRDTGWQDRGRGSWHDRDGGREQDRGRGDWHDRDGGREQDSWQRGRSDQWQAGPWRSQGGWR